MKKSGIGSRMVQESKCQCILYIFGCSLFFMNVCIGGEHIAHLVQSNKPMHKKI
jgi:hypothetical protein